MVKNGDIWTIGNVSFGNTATERFKFDVYGDWTKNYGGTGLEGTAVPGGGDIAVQAGKTYDITFNEKTLYYKVTPVLVPTFAVSGTISGYSINMIGVSSNTGISVQTDTNGNFSMSLANGTYVITPSKSGSTFSPANRTITVNNAAITGVNFISVQSTGLTIHYQEFEPATSYSIHCWDGLTADIQMVYEGYYNGSHWWKKTIINAPSNFKFCFFNSNGNWDGGNRIYANQANEIYIKKYDNNVYLTRP
jgi:hypothetical protein